MKKIIGIMGATKASEQDLVNNFYRNLAPNQVFIAKDYQETIGILENLCIGE